jgi:Predicted membrane protein
MNKAYLYIFLAAVIFSTMELAGKIVMADINPFQLNFIRFLIGALVLFPMALQSVRERNITFQMDDYLYFLAAGFLNVVVSMSLFQFSLLYIMASTVAVVFCVNPIFTTLFAHFLIREKFTGTAIVALAVSICGVLTVLDPFGLHADLRGIILIVLSAISFALYSVIAKMRVAGYGSVVLTCFSFLGGDAILLIVMLLSHLPVFNHLAAGVIPRFLVGIPIIAGITFHNIGVHSHHCRDYFSQYWRASLPRRCGNRTGFPVIFYGPGEKPRLNRFHCLFP